MSDQRSTAKREEPESGGEPQTFGRCTECGTVYPAQIAPGGEVRPVGTDGTCHCGNDEFATPTGE